MTDSDPAHPNPQLQRSGWISLDGPWRFRFDDHRKLLHPAEIGTWDKTIEVPFPPESAASGIDDRGFHPCCWYERDFELIPDGGRALLRFGAVDYSARVWVNGQLATTHEGGHTPFSVDITAMLDPSGRQKVSVMVVDDPHDLTKPRGKQDWQKEPHAIWYPRTTGIWQTVWIERVGRTYVEKIRWTPHVDSYALRFETRVSGDPVEDLSIEVTLRHGRRLLARDRYQVMEHEADRVIVLADPGIDDFRNELLWSPERPTLLDATVRLLSGEETIDEFTSYTALRSVSILRDRFMLNGRPYMLRMVLDQGYWPETMLAAPSDAALKKDVELAKAMGFNGVRKHQKIENPRYLYWADKLGLMVWEEMPSAYRFTRTAIKRTVREWSEAIERDYSHPCIVAWIPFNESWGVPELTNMQAQRHAVEALYHLTKTLDATRPVIGNDGWESSATDIIGIHDYDANTEHLRQRYGPEIKTEQLFDRRRPGGRVLTLDGYPHRGQPIMLTEFGGIALAKPKSATIPASGGTAAAAGATSPVAVAVDDTSSPTATTWGYSSARDIDELTLMFERLLETVVHTALFSGFCYTQFADTFQEANGLLRADRTPKIPLAKIAQCTTASRMHIPGGV